MSRGADFVGRTLGILGGGQLGRMSALAAKNLGIEVAVLDPAKAPPAAGVADHHAQVAFDDLEGVRAFARRVDVITAEFENVPAQSLAVAAEHVPVRPGPRVFEVAQDRLAEKTFARENGIPVGAFHEVSRVDDLEAALATTRQPAILKTATLGYDGKGQRRIDRSEEAIEAFIALGERRCILEAFVPFVAELSVVVARGVDGAMAVQGPMRNVHVRHILDVTTFPADLPASVEEEAASIARRTAEALDLIGVLCIELFLTADAKLLFNEIAPRPHNSGHWTQNGAQCSQFDQHVRAVMGLPLGDGRLLAGGAAMANLLGDLWSEGAPDFAAALEDPLVSLHLYGKAQARPGRKMGHLNAIGDDVADARRRVLAARERILRGG